MTEASTKSVDEALSARETTKPRERTPRRAALDPRAAQRVLEVTLSQDAAFSPPAATGGGEDTAPEAPRSVEHILLQAGLLKERDIARVRRYQKRHRCTVGLALTRLRLVSPSEVNVALAIQYGFVRAQTRARDLHSDLAVIMQPKSEAAEQIRLLRARLLTTRDPETLKLFSVAPAGYSSRADFLTANLAISFSQLNKKVLLVDADFASPRLGRLFRVQRDQSGLADVLSGSQASEDAILQTPFTNLSIMPAGARRENMAELIATNRLSRVFNDMQAMFDTVIVLSAPVSEEAMARYVWMATNATLVAARRHQTRFAELDRLEAAMRQVGASVIGAAMTR